MKVTYLTVCCAKNFSDIDTARASMSEKVLNVFFEKSPCTLFQRERTYHTQKHP